MKSGLNVKFIQLNNSSLIEDFNHWILHWKLNIFDETWRWISFGAPSTHARLQASTHYQGCTLNRTYIIRQSQISNFTIAKGWDIEFSRWYFSCIAKLIEDNEYIRIRRNLASVKSFAFLVLSGALYSSCNLRFTCFLWSHIALLDIRNCLLETRRQADEQSATTIRIV